jgi:hypothetical protein
MPEGIFTGGGSVLWTIKTDATRDTSDLALKQTLDNGMFTVNGIDRSDGAAYGKNFVISILPPEGTSAEAFLKRAKIVDGRVQFVLEIQRQPRVGDQDQYKPQIRVSWGRSVGAADADPMGGTAS